MLDRMREELVATRGARFLFISACLVVVVFGLRAGRPVLLPFTLALFLAVLSLPLMKWFQRHRLPTPVAIFVVMMLNVAVLGVIGLVVSQSITEFRVALPGYVDRFDLLATRWTGWLEARNVPVSRWVAPDLINPESLMGLVGGTLRGIASLLSSTFLVLLIMVFILAEATAFPTKLRIAMGREEVDFSRWAKVTIEVQQYLGIKTVVSLITGTLVGIWVGILGVDFALFWGLIAFLFNFVPNIGSILASVPPIILALLQFGPGSALLTGAGYLVVNVILGNMVEPNLQGRKFGISTLVVILSLIFWGWVWGPVGMILSLPLTMVLKISLENTEDFRWLAVLIGAAPREAPRAEPVRPRGEALTEV